MKKQLAKKTAKRSTKVKNSNFSTPAGWLMEWARGGVDSTSGEPVNERTALGLSAYLACIKNISEDEAKLPLCLYKRLEPRGRQEMPDHPVDRLIRNQPNSEMTAMTFRQTLTAHALGWHGGFAEIVRDGAGVPLELWPLDPTCVQVMREQEGQRRIYYWVTPSPAFGQMQQPGMALMPEDMFHIHGLGYNGVTGYVLSRIARDCIGNALAAQKFSGAFFSNGASLSGVLEVPDALSETAFKHLRDSWAARHQGAANQHKPAILEQGTKWTSISTDPQKSQMIDAIYLGVEDVARLFRMPPHKIGHLLRSTNNNIEQQALEYVQDCLLGWLVRWEQEIWRKLLSTREQNRLYAKHDTNMLMRGDSAARSAYYRELFNIGALSDNDIRECEDLNPVDGGDTYFVNSAMTPLDIAAEGPIEPQTQTDSVGTQQDGNQPTYTAADLHRQELQGRIAATATKGLESLLGGILKIEYERIEKARKSDNFGEKVSSFYQNGHKNRISEKLIPQVEALQLSLTACNGY